MEARDQSAHMVRRKVQYYEDPYLGDLHQEEVAQCKQCRSVYVNQRWNLESQAQEELQKAPRIVETLCPACQKIRDRMPGGVVTLSGSFLADHKDEIVRLIQHENDNAMAVNPLERIMDIEGADSEITVLTTNEKLAQRIGRAVHKAYSGEVVYKWSKGTKLARVNWHRD